MCVGVCVCMCAIRTAARKHASFQHASAGMYFYHQEVAAALLLLSMHMCAPDK